MRRLLYGWWLRWRRGRYARGHPDRDMVLAIVARHIGAHQRDG